MSYYKYLFYQNKSPFHHLFILEGKKKEKGQNQEFREKKIQRLKKEYKEKKQSHRFKKQKVHLSNFQKTTVSKISNQVFHILLLFSDFRMSLQNEHSPHFYKNFISRLTAFQAQMDWVARHSFLGFPSGLDKTRC